MSEPKRYNPSGLVCTCCGKPDAEIQSIMVTHNKGRYVQWDDYARLKAEFDEYRKAATISADSVIDERNRLQAEVKYLQDKVERLTAEASYDKRVQLHVDKLAAEFTQSEVERLKAENERLRASSFVTAVPSEEYEKLKAEVERLKIYDVEHWQDQWLLVVEDNNKLRAEVDWLCKAGDAVALDYAERIEIEAGDTAKNLMRKLPVLREWNAAKEGRPNE